MDMHDRKQLATEIANWTQDLEYRLGNLRRAEAAGAVHSAADNRLAAAQAASILLALKGMM